MPLPTRRVNAEAYINSACRPSLPSANLLPEGKPQVVSEARDNNANFAWVHHFIHHQSRTPATLRDTLLPKLLSGEITIPAAE